MGSFRFKVRAGCEFMLKRVGAEGKKLSWRNSMAHMNQKLAIANMLCRNVSNGVLSKLFRSKFRLAHRMACSPEAFVALRHVGMTACGICACITKSSHFPKKYKKKIVLFRRLRMCSETWAKSKLSSVERGWEMHFWQKLVDGWSVPNKSFWRRIARAWRHQLRVIAGTRVAPTQQNTKKTTFRFPYAQCG